MFQDSYNGLEEVFSDSPQTMKNESIEKAENDSVEETEPYVRIWTAEELIEMERSNIQSQSARQYEIQQYEYEGDTPQDIRELSDEEGSMDRPNAYACLCAMEEFCGGTDYTVLEIKYTSIFGDWMVLFEKDGEQYVCAIGEVCTSFTICDMAVWKQSRCAEASQILLTVGQNLKFRSHSQRKTLRNGGRNKRGKED